MRFTVWFLLTCLLPLGLFAQLSGRVKNASTGDALPYVNVYNKSLKKGTVTDQEGRFEIPTRTDSDSIYFSFIGFKTFLFVSGDRSEIEIALEPVSLRIDEVVVLPEGSDALYNLIIACAKNRPQSEGVAQSYLELKSFVDGSQVELLEGYFNSNFSAYEVSDMQLKTGRVGLRKWRNRFFASVEASQALTRTLTFGNNPYFPDQPTQFNKRKMKRNFSLRFSGSYRDASGDSVLVITFTPKFEYPDAFSGTYWVKPEKRLIQKIELEVKDPISHPFRPLFPDDEVKLKSMSMSKTFTGEAENFAPEQIEMKYTVSYLAEDNTQYETQTSLLWKAFNFQDTFFIPRFGLEQNKDLSDYHLLARAPYNAYFWEGEQAFAMSHTNAANRRFMEDSANLNSLNIWEPNQYSKVGFFEVAYIPWSKENRVQFEPVRSRRTEEPSWTPIWDNFQLSAKIYFDLVEQYDSVKVITRTLWDPYSTYYPYEMDPEALAFINIYFDLLEMRRRGLHQKVEKVKNDRTAAFEAYLQFVDAWEAEQKKYIFELSRGKNEEALKKWNAKVRDAIGIDNMAIFEVKN